nr:immunoglobulin light chain junction region [Macaca mulatta]MOX74703.1 immunoglobulin light chain junction region [Macaca mulatta]MOX75196.1 immunoglobulin light chain junction region [Macaca mulatta]MOX77413.1 immunoglobulin light chain junction region [Macaca mulatta]
DYYCQSTDDSFSIFF